MHTTKFLVNKSTLKIKEVYLNDCPELKELLEIDNVLFDNYENALKYQNYMDTSVKFN